MQGDPRANPLKVTGGAVQRLRLRDGRYWLGFMGASET